MLRNPRHEKFCREYLKTGIASRAYLAAGYRVTKKKALTPCSSRLLACASIKARLATLRSAMATRQNITVDTLLADLESDRQLAQAEGQASAAVQATMAKARLLGLIIDRKESGHPGDFHALKSIADIVDAVRQQLGTQAAEQLQALMQASTEGGKEGAEARDGAQQETPQTPNAPTSGSVN